MVGPKEEVIEDYFERMVHEAGGVSRKIRYRGRRGCADQLAGFPANRLFLVELKRPKGGKISAHQHEDMQLWLSIGALKEFLHTKAAVDDFIRRVKAHERLPF